MEKSNKIRVKIIIDIIMILLLVLMFNKRVISMSFHEIGGLVFFAIFITHIALNWKWITSVTLKLFDKQTSARLRISWLVNLVLLISIIGIIITGISMNKTLPFKIGRLSGCQQIHYFIAAILIVFMGIHLGLHWPLFKGLVSKVSLFQRRIIHIIGVAILIITVGSGCCFLATGNFGRWISGPFIGGAPGNMHIQAGSSQNENGSFVEKPDFSDSDFQPPEGFAPGEDKQPNDYESTGNTTNNDMHKFKEDKIRTNSFSAINVITVIFTYFSEMIVFSFITVLFTFICSLIKRKNNN